MSDLYSPGWYDSVMADDAIDPALGTFNHFPHERRRPRAFAPHRVYDLPALIDQCVASHLRRTADRALVKAMDQWRNA